MIKNLKDLSLSNVLGNALSKIEKVADAIQDGDQGAIQDAEQAAVRSRYRLVVLIMFWDHGLLSVVICACALTCAVPAANRQGGRSACKGSKGSRTVDREPVGRRTGYMGPM